MRVVSIHEAKTHLSRLIEACINGEEIVIAKRDRPVVRLMPVRSSSARRQLGLHRGQVDISPDFDAPIADFEEYR
jgi:prevent-host-death family protein